MKTMKTINYTKYGNPDVLTLKEVEKPAPRENEILIKVYAASVNYGDLVAQNFKNIKPRQFNMPFLFWVIAKVYFGIRKPKVNVLGSEFAGKIEAIGSKVKRFKVGNQVFGYLGQSMGAYSEYLCMPENGVVALKPTNMTYEEAASVPSGGMTALYILKTAKIRVGIKILVNGASGGIGSIAVQLAKNSGAEVTAVCSTQREEFVKSLGAHKVIDYTKEDFTKNGEKYDIIFDILGKGSFKKIKGSLKKNGVYLLASFKMKKIIQMLWTKFTAKKVKCVLSPQELESLVELKEMVEAGKIRSVVDKSFSPEQISKAHWYVEKGKKQGNVVIKFA